MGGRLSFLRRKRAKQAATVPDAVPTVVEAPPPPPPEVFDSTTFWEALKGILRFRLPQGSDLVPIDKSTLHIHDATKLSDDELDDVKEVSKALGDRLTTSNALLSTTKKEDAAMELFTYALSLLALGNTVAACDAFVNVIATDPSFGRAYTNLAHTLLLDTQDDAATLERVVGYLENALKYDGMEIRENTILLAEVQSLLGNHTAALDVYGRLTDVEKEWENVFHMARCEWALGRFDKSIALLDTLQLDANDAMDPSMSNKRLVLADAQALFMRPHGGADVAAS